MTIPDHLITELVAAFEMDEQSVRHLLSIRRLDVFGYGSRWRPDPKEVIKAFEEGRIEEIIQYARIFARRERILEELQPYLNR